jgi:SAM-dependent methyltransferase
MDLNFQEYRTRFREGEWRGYIFRDLILSEIQRYTAPTVLDIGCGRGIDDNQDLQREIARASAKYIGIEPDAHVALPDVFHETHRCFFEDAPLAENSVDVAFCVMVLEHLEQPQAFWDKVHTVLRKGGVFWGFSMDIRFYFPAVSLAFEKLRLKEIYLNALHGKRGEDRYDNYPVFYRSNSPAKARSLGKNFASVTSLNLGCVGQLDFYYPAPLRWIGRSIDSALLATDLPGSVFAVRATK